MRDVVACPLVGNPGWGWAAIEHVACLLAYRGILQGCRMNEEITEWMSDAGFALAGSDVDPHACISSSCVAEESGAISRSRDWTLEAW